MHPRQCHHPSTVLIIWVIRCYYGKQDFLSARNATTRTYIGAADYFTVFNGRPSSDNVEVLNRFSIEDMYALHRTMFQDRHQQVKVDLLMKVILHDSNLEKFHKDEFVPGQEVLLNYNLTENLIYVALDMPAADYDVMYLDE